MWSLGGYGRAPDGQGALQRLRQPADRRPEPGALPAAARSTRVYEQLQALPDGPERAALFRQAKRLAVAYMPYKLHTHRIFTDMAQPWVVGYRRPVFWQDWWHIVDIDPAAAKRR